MFTPAKWGWNNPYKLSLPFLPSAIQLSAAFKLWCWTVVMPAALVGFSWHLFRISHNINIHKIIEYINI